MKHILRLAIVALSLSAEQAQAEISYGDILADPDNPVLNQEFARQRLAGGDAKAALAAVERVLVAEPTNLGARLFPRRSAGCFGRRFAGRRRIARARRPALAGQHQSPRQKHAGAALPNGANV